MRMSKSCLSKISVKVANGPSPRTKGKQEVVHDGMTIGGGKMTIGCHKAIEQKKPRHPALSIMFMIIVILKSRMIRPRCGCLSAQQQGITQYLKLVVMYYECSRKQKDSSNRNNVITNGAIVRHFETCFYSSALPFIVILTVCPNNYALRCRPSITLLIWANHRNKMKR